MKLILNRSLTSTSKIIKSFLQSIVDFIYPNVCIHCSVPINRDDHYLCPICWSAVERVHDDDKTVRVLHERFSEAGTIDRFFSLYYFEEGKPLQSLIHGLKYRGLTKIGIFLGREVGLSLQSLSPSIGYDLIIPVPLHRSKQRERGFNQSDFIARGIGASCGIPVEKKIFRRKKYTQSQTTLTLEQRSKNVESAFILNDVSFVEKKNILLIDDVITTGSTILECSKVLKKTGATSIAVCSIALAKLE